MIKNTVEFKSKNNTTKKKEEKEEIQNFKKGYIFHSIRDDSSPCHKLNGRLFLIFLVLLPAPLSKTKNYKHL